MFRRQLLQSSRAVTQRITQIPRTQQITSSPFSSLSSRSARIAQPAPSSQTWSRRWQSTEAAKSEESKDSSDTQAAPQSSDEVAALKQEIEKKNKEVIDMKDKYLRSVAEYRNLQDRTQRDSANARNFAIQKFATDILDSIDNLDRALGSVPEAAVSSDGNPDLLNLYNGLRMTEKILMQTLEKHGLSKYDPLEREGKKFDPNLDEATFFAKQEGRNDGEVFYTQQKGYTLNKRVIRASKVGVVKNS
ncbi:GrpE, mitochondrial [Lithohypha guttulata]|uniref:GrpE protein homolog, mitochondrial n=1 Tax=Lithohypha guttulata TaxID=1690604 RepID=A0AAN7Y6P6_9EURO|nr:GrpE, mitochondrial [Lithohypha guttulata]KAK5086533.1 GrpE, mitochondrial [Lithohypha guttulata]